MSIIQKRFEEFTLDGWKPPSINEEAGMWCYTAMCMTGEAGETADGVKKLIKGTKDKDYVALEIGDTLHYLTVLAKQLGYTLEDIMAMNMKKLVDRRKQKK